MVFSCFRGQSGTAPHHLTIQAPHLGWSENHNTIHRRAIPALCQEHRIAQHSYTSRHQNLSEFQLCPAVSIYFCRPKSILIQQITEFLAGLYQRKEHHRFLSRQYFCISSAMPCRYGSKAVPISLALKSPACTDTLLISILSGIVSA